MNSTRSGLLRFCTAAVSFIMVFITGYLFLLSIFGDCMINAYAGYETTVYLTDSPLFQLSSVVLILLTGFLISSHPRIAQFLSGSEKIILLTVHIIFAIAMLSAILLCEYKPTAAQEWTLNAALCLLNGDYSFWIRSGFNYIYPVLNALSLYLVPFVSLFGIKGAAAAFQILNLAMLLFASRSLYGFCKEAKLDAAKTSVAFILYLPMGFYIFFIYGNMISLSLSIFSVWMFVRFLNLNAKKDIFASAISIAFAISFKETALITLIAIIILLVLHSILSQQWRKLLWLPLFAAVSIFLTLITDITIEGITKEPVPDGMGIYGHLTMGLSEGERAEGWYNNYTLDTLSACGFDYSQYEAITKEAFLQRSGTLLEDPSYAVRFFSHKTASQWNNPTFQSIWIQQQMLNAEGRSLNAICIDGSPANMLFYFMFNILQSTILFGSLCYFIFDSKDNPLTALLPAVTFIGGFLFLLFWEAKAQYTVLFFILLIPYSITGLLSLFHRLLALKGNRRWFASKVVIFLGLLAAIILLVKTDLPVFNNTVNLGTGEADAYYNYYLEQNVYRQSKAHT